jgi:predicted ATPase
MHTFRNFKCFSKAEISLFSPFTVLIGPNGSGKSNTIEGIQLLSVIAEGLPLHSITDIGQGGIFEIRGGLKGCSKYGSDSFELGFDAVINYQNEKRGIKYKIEISTHSEPKIHSESLYFSDGELIYDALSQNKSSSSDIHVKYNNFARGGTKPQTSVSSGKSVLAQYELFASSIKNFKSISRVIQVLRNYLSSSFIFDPEPKLMRNYERTGHSKLYKNGSNLSAVLFELSKSKPEILDRIFQLTKEFPDRPYEKFNFIETPLNDVIFSLVESGNNTSSRVLSDGTLRVIAVLAALETTNIFSRIVIEEFDNGLHPSRVKILFNAAVDAATRRKMNVLVTTHNPETLNHLTEDQVKSVFLCVRRTPKSDCELISLQDLPRHEELMARGRLGDLVSERIVNQYLNPSFELEREKLFQEFMSRREANNA